MKKSAIALACAMLFAGAGQAADQQGPVDDAQIAAILHAANEADIDGGKAAQKQAANAQVKAYGQRMVTDHTDADKSAKDLFKKINVKPKDNATSDALKSDAKEHMKKMKDMKGAEFDKAYIDHEVTMHQSLLDTIDKSLAPAAKNEEVKGLLGKMRPVIEAHLQQAKQIQGSLGGGK